MEINKLNKTDIRFLNMLLRDVQYSPRTKEGLGFKPYAYYLEKKINGDISNISDFSVKDYESNRLNYFNKIMKKGIGSLFNYVDYDFFNVKRLIRIQLTKIRNIKREEECENGF